MKSLQKFALFPRILNWNMALGNTWFIYHKVYRRSVISCKSYF